MPVPTRSPQTSGGRFVRPTEKKPGADLASATKTANFTSPAFSIEDASQIDAQLVVTASSGTSPTLQLKLQVSQDGVTWADAAPSNYPNVTGNGTTNYSFGCPGVQGRWVVTIGGTTPSFTYSLDTQAVINAL